MTSLPPYEYVTSRERLGSIANEIASAHVVALDLETTYRPEWKALEGAAFSPHTGRIRLCSINTGKGIYVIDVFQTGDLGPVATALHNPNEEWGAGRPVCVLQNAKFDQKYLLYYYGIELGPVFDTFKASALIYNGKRMGHNLYDLYARELSMAPIAPDLGGSDWSAPNLTNEQIDYAAEDVVFLPGLRDVLRAKMERLGLFKIALLEFGAILPEAEVEINGFPIDTEAWKVLAAENDTKMRELARQLMRELPHPRGQMLLPGAADWIVSPESLLSWALSAGNDEDEQIPDDERAQRLRAWKPKGKDPMRFNLDSTDQMLKSLHRLGGGLEALTSTAEMELAMHSQEHPIISKLLDYRSYATKLKSFGLDYLNHISPVTGRIHANYFAMLVTGRYGCLPKSAMVATDRGLVPLGTVRPGDKVQTPDGPRKVLEYQDTGRKPVLRFVLERGRVLECTGEHIVLSNGRWVRADTIQVGDCVYASGVEGPASTDYVRLGLPITERARTPVCSPATLDVRLAFLLGHYIAEGCVGYGRQRPRKRPTRHTKGVPDGARVARSVILALGHDEDDLRDFLVHEYSWYFGEMLAAYKKYPSPSLTFSSVGLAQWFLDMGCGGYSTEKRVPPAILVSPHDVQAAFLRGLFEGDGCASTGYPSLSTDSLGLAEDVGVLLAAQGVHYWHGRRARENGQIRHTVTVMAQSCDSQERVALFWSDRKRDRLRESGTAGQTKTGVEPPPWLDRDGLYRRCKAYYRWTGPDANQNYAWNFCYRQRRITSEGLRWAHPALPVDAPLSESEQFIRAAHTQNLMSLRVLAVETLGPQDVCDIEVEGNHCFLVNGIVVHNCQRPNLAQIPRDKKYRQCFKAPEGSQFVMADYSGIELRLIAEASRDPTLVRLFKENVDPHRYTASRLVQKPEDQVTKEERQQAKPANFGFCLVSGTPVSTTTGLVPIEQLRAGDLVRTHRGRWRPVTATQSYVETACVYVIETASGRRVRCTADHGWYVATQGPDYRIASSWVPAERLREGDRLVQAHVPGGLDAITRVRTEPYNGRVYDVTVEEDHSFVAEGLVTHNCYGMKEDKFVLYAMTNYGVRLTLQEAKKFRTRYFDEYRGLVRWHAEMLSQGKRTRMSTTPLGRLRYMDEKAHNEYLNHPIQSAGADGLKKALRRVYFRTKKYGGAVKMVHHVHDEIITQTPKDPEIGKAWGADLQEAMEGAMSEILKTVPVVADPGVGSSWADK